MRLLQTMGTKWEIFVSHLSLFKGDSSKTKNSATKMGYKIILVALAVIFTTSLADYVRTSSRQLSLFNWGRRDSQPQQVHVSLAGDKHMQITWITNDASSPVVKYGTSPGVYTLSALANTTSYRYMLYRSGIIYNAVIGPLDHNTFYYYRCGGQGHEFKLKTPPQAFPITFAVAGDLGQTYWTKSTLDHISKCEYDVLLLPGDLSYADCMQHKWDTFGDLVQPQASSRPWMVTEGNHEKEHIPFVTDSFVAYNSRWKMPSKGSGSGSNLYYSFEVANVHVVMLGSYEDCDKHSDQYRWLQYDLSRVDKERTPWLLVVFHVPWYSSNYAHQGEGYGMMASLEPLFYAARVDLVFAGHVHAYERTERMLNGRQNSCGPVHITIGAGGNREGLARRWFTPAPDWSLFREASFGHGMLHILNATHAHWSWHRNNDSEAVLSDFVWIKSLASSHC